MHAKSRLPVVARGWRGWFRVLSWLATLAMVGSSLVLHVLGDLWWPTIALLYGPRWLFAIFPVATIPWAVTSRKRHAMALTAVATAVFLLGFIDLRVGIDRLRVPNGMPLRAIEFNLAGAAADESRTVAWLRAMHPTVVFLVECKGDRGAVIARALAMHVRVTGSLCLLATYPIDDWVSRDQKAFWRRYGSGAIARGTIRHPDGAINVGIVHLATPRHVLDTFGDLSEVPFRGPAVRENIALRNDESAAAREWIGGPGSVDIVGGDFNLPVESAVYRRHWHDFTNAFSSVGIGLGRTKRTRLIGVRIDHVLVGSRLAARAAGIGPDLGSDHRPVIVDLVVR